ncbi:MAG: hypothetical protein V4582_15275 [Pseudomonadota bacterium]
MRRTIIAVALVATLVAAYFAPDGDNSGVVAPVRAPASGAVQAAGGAAQGTMRAASQSVGQSVGQGAAVSALVSVAPAPRGALAIRPRGADDELGNLFAGRGAPAPSGAMQPAVSVAVKPRAPAPDARKQAQAGANSAPPLPIRFLGRFIDGGSTAYFLQAGDGNVVARVGEHVGANYTFDSAEGGTLSFTYLPLHQKQVLVVGDMN